MAFRGSVSSDPVPVGSSYEAICFGCGSSERRWPSAPYPLRPNQILLRAAVDTRDIQNPFATFSVCISSGLHLFLCFSAVGIFVELLRGLPSGLQEVDNEIPDLVSMMIGMYLLPCCDGGLNGPHMSLLNAAPT